MPESLIPIKRNQTPSNQYRPYCRECHNRDQKDARLVGDKQTCQKIPQICIEPQTRQRHQCQSRQQWETQKIDLTALPDGKLRYTVEERLNSVGGVHIVLLIFRRSSFSGNFLPPNAARRLFSRYYLA